jgi:hypothetical protein
LPPLWGGGGGGGLEAHEVPTEGTHK